MAAEVVIDGGAVYGSGSLAHPVLIVRLELVLRAPSEPPSWLCFKSIGGRLSPFDSSYIADCRSVHLFENIAPGVQNSGRQVYLEIPLDQRRLSLIEGQRQGNDCKLRLDLELFVDEMRPVGGHEFYGRTIPYLALVESRRLQRTYEFVVNKSHWGERVLPGLGYGKTHVIELPAMPLESVARFSKAFTALQQAQTFHREGRYGETVGKVRLALEQLTEPEEYTDDKGVRRTRPILKRAWQTRLGEATYTWINESIKTLKRPANDAVHGNRDNFSQFEAQMLITVATTVIAYAAQHALDGEQADVAET